MVSDLRSSHLGIGCTEDEVLRLLGKPDPQSEPTTFEREVDGGASVTILHYYLGDWSGMRVDADALDVALEKEGRLEKTWFCQL